LHGTYGRVQITGAGLAGGFVSQYDVELGLDPDFHRPYLTTSSLNPLDTPQTFEPTTAEQVTAQHLGPRSSSLHLVFDPESTGESTPGRDFQSTPDNYHSDTQYTPPSESATSLSFSTPSDRAYGSTSTPSSSATLACHQCDATFRRYCDLKYVVLAVILTPSTPANEPAQQAHRLQT
jgi:hypothetical protein